MTDDGFIPEAWRAEVLRRTKDAFTFPREWNERCERNGYHAAKIAPRPLRKRVSSAIRMWQNAAREWLAVKIAPWLAPEDDW